MYLTSFIHRGELFEIAQRWFCGQSEPDDALRLTKIFICDGYIVGETLEVIAEQMLRKMARKPVRKRRIRVK